MKKKLLTNHIKYLYKHHIGYGIQPIHLFLITNYSTVQKENPKKALTSLNVTDSWMYGNYIYRKKLCWIKGTWH